MAINVVTRTSFVVEPFFPILCVFAALRETMFCVNFFGLHEVAEISWMSVGSRVWRSDHRLLFYPNPKHSVVQADFNFGQFRGRLKSLQGRMNGCCDESEFVAVKDARFSFVDVVCRRPRFRSRNRPAKLLNRSRCPA